MLAERQPSRELALGQGRHAEDKGDSKMLPHYILLAVIAECWQQQQRIKMKNMS